MAVSIEEDYVFIKETNHLEEICAQLKEQPWIGFDTEFIGEKRFYTLLCLIQINSPIGCFLIDPIAVKQLQPFLDLIENPDILKITHAGENDYRLLYQQFDILPRNVFDTQIAAGFLGYNYPTAFRKIMDKELQIRLKKGFAVAVWDQRPLSAKHIQYALNDVIFLKELYDKLHGKLVRRKRLDWCEEEFAKMESPEGYSVDVYAEALNNNMISHLSKREQVFMLRVYKWRIDEAKKKDYSKEMILSSKYINLIVKNIKQGEAALKNNRLLPKNFYNRYGATIKRLYESPIQPIEEAALTRIPRKHEISPVEDITHSILYALVKKKCLNAGISQNLVFPKSAMSNFKYNPNWLADGWRAKILGKELVGLCKRIEDLQYEFSD
ncbi:MAG: ribonuclease D, partial [Bacteroidota bacterium]